MLVLLLCLGHMFPHSSSASEASCPGKKYMLRYDKDHSLNLRG